MADPSGDGREPIEVLAEEFLERRRRGETPSMKEYVERHPELADEIRELFPALAVMHDIDPAPAELGESRAAPAPRRLGDYRILRTIGRGGMGVVYEAEQLSLGRRVALKILSPQAVGDGRARERFRREARAAARLHHTNIVPVFDIGEEGAACYYAMQLIPGQGLDRVIDELRRLRARPDPGKASPAEDATTAALPGDADAPPERAGGAACSLLTGVFELRAAAGPSEPTPPPTTSALGRRAA
ncbi:MAG TPA: protein kinase, partial [Gemmataceae bacterium]|nr:protein kinase [Gemmataceae bacterium]